MRIIDLTQPMENGMPVMDGITPPAFRDLADVATDGYAMSEYRFVNHTGTHVDAPGAVGLDLLGRHLPAIRPGDIVLLSSGNARNWGTDAYWHGWCYPDADAARALIRAGVAGVGFDGPSADPVDSTDYALHQIWLGSGKIILENLADLSALPARCPIVVAPLKVRGANGGPARVLALPPG